MKTHLFFLLIILASSSALAGNYPTVTRAEILPTKQNGKNIFKIRATFSDGQVKENIPAFWNIYDRNTIDMQGNIQIDHTKSTYTNELVVDPSFLDKHKGGTLNAYVNTMELDPDFRTNPYVTSAYAQIAINQVAPVSAVCDNTYIAFGSGPDLTFKNYIDSYTNVRIPQSSAYFAAEWLRDKNVNLISVTSTPEDKSTRIRYNEYTLVPNGLLAPLQSTQYKFKFESKNIFGESQSCEVVRNVNVSQDNIAMYRYDLQEIKQKVGYNLPLHSNTSYRPIRQGAVSDGDRLYLFGGDTPAPINDFTVVDFRTKVRIRLPDSPLAGRARPLMAILRDKVVVFGGTITKTKSTLFDGAVFDTSSNTWSVMKTPPVGNVTLNKVITGLGSYSRRVLFAVDGGKAVAGVPYVLMYDESNDTWLAINPPKGITKFTGNFFWSKDNIIYLDRDGYVSGKFSLLDFKWTTYKISAKTSDRQESIENNGKVYYLTSKSEFIELNPETFQIRSLDNSGIKSMPSSHPARLFSVMDKIVVVPFKTTDYFQLIKKAQVYTYMIKTNSWKAAPMDQLKQLYSYFAADINSEQTIFPAVIPAKHLLIFYTPGVLNSQKGLMESAAYIPEENRFVPFQIAALYGQHSYLNDTGTFGFDGKQFYQIGGWQDLRSPYATPEVTLHSVFQYLPETKAEIGYVTYPVTPSNVPFYEGNLNGNTKNNTVGELRIDASQDTKMQTTDQVLGWIGSKADLKNRKQKIVLDNLTSRAHYTLIIEPWWLETAEGIGFSARKTSGEAAVTMGEFRKFPLINGPVTKQEAWQIEFMPVSSSVEFELMLGEKTGENQAITNLIKMGKITLVRR